MSIISYFACSFETEFGQDSAPLLNHQTPHHPEGQISNFQSPTSACKYNAELTTVQPSWVGSSEQHRHLEPTQHAPGPWHHLSKCHNKEEKKRITPAAAKPSLTLPYIMLQVAPLGDPVREHSLPHCLPCVGA